MPTKGEGAVEDVSAASTDFARLSKRIFEAVDFPFALRLRISVIDGEPDGVEKRAGKSAEERDD